MIGVCIALDAEELLHDIERIENGELDLPTVSAIKVSINDSVKEFPIWLPEV